jgi:hypothetical protein
MIECVAQRINNLSRCALCGVNAGLKLTHLLQCALRSWTISCGGFDRLPGVVILELCWAQVA